MLAVRSHLQRYMLRIEWIISILMSCDQCLLGRPTIIGRSDILLMCFLCLSHQASNTRIPVKIIWKVWHSKMTQTFAHHSRGVAREDQETMALQSSTEWIFYGKN